MKTELYRAIRSIDKAALSEDDKEELLKLFMVTGNPLIRDWIVMIFGDIRYNKAVPYIIKKVWDKSLQGNTGVLVASLRKLDAAKYYNEFAKIICEQDYEPRLWALDLLEDFGPSVSVSLKKKALKTLIACRNTLAEIPEAAYKNSRQQFVDEAVILINNAMK